MLENTATIPIIEEQSSWNSIHNVFKEFVWMFCLTILYILEYILGLELNPVLNWTRVNLPIQIGKFKSL